MRKLISWILTIVLSGLLIVPVNAEELLEWDGVSFDTSWYNTSDKSFTISTPAQFAGFAQIVAGKADGISKDSFGGKTIALACDLDFADEALQPVGVATSAFKGTFDGSGHIIKNIRIIPWSGDENGEVGLFARVQGGTIKKLGIENIEVSYSLDSAAKGNFFAGGLAGHIRENAVIEDCFIRNVTLSDFTNNGGLFGGLVGQIRAGATVKNCYTTNVSSGTNVTASNALVSNFIAKITSHAGETIISNCYAGVYNEFSGVNEVIGAVGTENSSAEISDVYFDSYENLNSWVGKTKGTFVTTENLKANDGEVNLINFVVNDDEEYNYGYPVLSWESDSEATPPPVEETVFEVVNKTESSVELTYIENALYSMDNIEWTDSNIFENLTKGVYKFYMKTSAESETVYERITSVGERFDEFDVWDGGVDTRWYNPDETVFYISTAEEFAGLAELSRTTANGNFVGKEIYLMSNLDMDNRDFNPIGYGVAFFGGKFVGNGHIIKNINITDTAGDREIGLFGRLDGTVEKLGVENITLNGVGQASSKYNVGGFVGYARYATISECFVRNVDAASLENAITYLGGFAGYLRGCNVTSCYVTDFTISDTDVVADRIANFSANVIEDTKLSGCYSGFDNPNSLYDVCGFAQAAATVAVSECYYDTLGNGSGSGSAVDTSVLKELKRMDLYFKLPYDDVYNCGYPVLEWEKYNDITYKQIDLYKENGQVYFKLTGLKNNTEDDISPVAVCAVYKDGYMTDAGCEIISDISGYSMYGDIIVAADEGSEGSEAKGMLYTACDKGIPLVKSLVLN